MKTSIKDYSLNSHELVTSNDDLEEVINHRQEKFYGTSDYQKESEKAKAIIKTLEEIIPKEYETIGKLKDTILTLECICYSAAYRDGMADLMTAMTFNNLHITRAEY